MRILMWFALGFGTACLLGAYLLSAPAMIVFGMCTFLLAIGGLILFREVSRKRAGAILLLGLSLGMLWFQIFTYVSLAPLKKADGEVIDISAEASDYSYPTAYGAAVKAKVKLDDRVFSAKLYLNEAAELSPGDCINGSFQLRFTGPKGQQDATYHSGNGMFLLCYAKGESQIVYRNDQSAEHFPARLRKQIVNWVDTIFPGNTAAFAKALLLGDTTGLTYEEDTALTLSGIVHVVSVSGLHISILFTLLFRLFGSRRVMTPLVGIGLLVFAAAVTGFSPSIIRACLMNGLMLLALMVNRDYDSPTGLAFAVVVMLGFNPLAATSIGFQLSVFSVMGIQLFAEPIADKINAWNIWCEAKRRSLLARFRNWVSGTVSVSLGAAILSAPLTALHFGTVSLVGILTNMLTLWVVNVLFVGIIVAVLLAPFWINGAKILAWLLSWGIQYVLGTAKILGAFPLAAVYTESIYIVIWLVSSYVMMFAWLLVRDRQRGWQLFLCSALILAIAIGASYAEPRLDSYRITVVDVGQGQCVLLQSSGRTYMVDCGGEVDKDAADKAIAVLYSQGLFKLDGLILTHYDRDHVGGVPYLLSRIPVDTLYLPIGLGSASWDSISDMAKDSAVVMVDEDIHLNWSDAAIDVYTSPFQETTNESSLCVLFQKENYDILITGDRSAAGEIYLIRTEQIPMLDALVAGHHGSGLSTCEYLLENTRPETVLISVGDHNAYGHPADAVLERLEDHGCIVRRTDQEGTIIIRR